MKKFSYLLFFAVLLTITGCTKPADNNTNVTVSGGPTVTTAEAQNITSTSALLGGSITAEGACTVLTSGVVLSTSHSPTTSDVTLPNITTSGVSSFTVTASGLLPSTTYYARAYAANCKGINYGNEIHFTTLGGGGGGTDTGYFHLLFDGVTYGADDLLGPNSGHVYPEGDIRYAILTLDSSTGEFGVAAQSSYLTDDAQTSGYHFGLIYKPLSGTGTYHFSGSADATKATEIQTRSGTGALDPLSSNYNQYTSAQNATRHMSGSSCIETEIACATNTLTITSWGPVGGFVEGTAAGTVYENVKTSYSCSNSTAHTYSASFKLKRIQ